MMKHELGHLDPCSSKISEDEQRLVGIFWRIFVSEHSPIGPASFGLFHPYRKGIHPTFRALVDGVVKRRWCDMDAPKVTPTYAGHTLGYARLGLQIHMTIISLLDFSDISCYLD